MICRRRSRAHKDGHEEDGVTVVGMLIGWLLGAMLTAGVPVAAGLPPPLGWVVAGPSVAICLVGLVVLVGVLYLFVSLATTNGQPATTNIFGEFCLGALIGVNAGANFMLVNAALFIAFGLPALIVSPFVAGALSLINALAAIRGLASAPWFAAVLGWASWAMPMSWLATAIGLVFFVINLCSIVWGVPLRVRCEWWTGTVIVHGGVTYLGRNGYNLGNFSFFHPDFGDSAPWLDLDAGPTPLPNPGTVQGLTFHETGHTLNVAACGGLFHFIGFLDQSMLAGAFAYAEQLAEGHLHSAIASWIDWWRPQIAAIGGGQRNTPANAVSFVVAPAVVAVGTAIRFDRTDLSTVPVSATDADGYPQGSVNPGVIPPVGFLWTVASAPAGSVATFALPNSAVDTFTPDVGGDYVVRLHYSDGANGSPGLANQTGPLSPAPTFAPAGPSPQQDSDTIVVIEARSPAVVVTRVNTDTPLSSAGTSAGVLPALLWAITQQPAGANASLASERTATAVFRADTPDPNYLVTLTVTAGAVSHTSTTRIQVEP
jgi:hypothetical protein